MPQNSGKCYICGKILNNPLDPKSLDCGGDCLECMESIEKENDGDDD